MYKLLLCVRYLRTRYIALASIVSVMLGVATMIVVNSVMAGFGNEMRDRIHGFLADIVVESRSMDGIENADAQMKIVEEAAGEFISAMTATVEVPAMVTFGDPVTGETFTQPIQLVGIDPAGKAAVGPLKDNLASYQPVMRDGKVVSEPLRSRETPVSFELTEHAAEHRRRQKEAERLFLRGRQASAPWADPSGSDPAGAEQPTGEASEAVAVSEEPPLEPSFDDPIEVPDDTSVPAPSFDEPAGVVAAEPADPAAPLAARLFVGEQIISFQARDPQTGLTEKVHMVQPGDDIIITTIQSHQPPEPTHFTATVCDVFRSGMSEYDGQMVLMNLEELQKIRGMLIDTDADGTPDVDAVTSIQISLNDYANADEVVRRLKAAFPPGIVQVSTWESKQGLLLEAVEMETAILNVLLFMIIAVAGFGILAIFFMIVVEKTRDIGILKSLGASSSGVMSIFLSYGLGLGVVGSAAGVGMGLLFVRYINEIEDGLSYITGRKVFDEQIYYFTEIPTQVSAMMVFWVAVGAISIAVLASVLPARRASLLHPVRALRYE